jgi:hypothetical protein
MVAVPARVAGEAAAGLFARTGEQESVAKVGRAWA